MKKSYIREMEQLLTKGMNIVNSVERDEWDTFIEEVDTMNEHLKIALRIIKEAE